MAGSASRLPLPAVPRPLAACHGRQIARWCPSPSLPALHYAGRRTRDPPPPSSLLSTAHSTKNMHMRDGRDRGRGMRNGGCALPTSSSPPAPSKRREQACSGYPWTFSAFFSSSFGDLAYKLSRPRQFKIQTQTFAAGKGKEGPGWPICGGFVCVWGVR